MTVGARVRLSKTGQAVGYENRRARVVAGGGLIATGLFYAVLATAISAFGAAVLLPLSLLFVVLGVRTAYANVLLVAPPFLELRYTFHTKRVPLEQIDHCRPRTDSDAERVRYVKICPEIIMNDGRHIRFNLIQWLPRNREVAAEACEQITAMIRSSLAT